LCPASSRFVVTEPSEATSEAEGPPTLLITHDDRTVDLSSARIRQRHIQLASGTDDHLVLRNLVETDLADALMVTSARHTRSPTTDSLNPL